jgi:gluconokinase
MPVAVVLMGVSASGKSTVMEAMVERLGWPSAQANAFHSDANVAKMSAGWPLSDDDR